MDYKAKLDEMATEMYREFDLDGQDDYERAKAFLRAHFPEPAKDARELADLVWDIVHEAGGPYSEQSGLQQIVDAIERFVQARLAARGQEGAREGFLEAAADAGIGQAANSVDLARKWQARAEKVESEAKALREALTRIDFKCQPGDDGGNIEWWITVDAACKGAIKIGHGSIIMRAFTDWKRSRDAALRKESPHA